MQQANEAYQRCHRRFCQFLLRAVYPAAGPVFLEGHSNKRIGDVMGALTRIIRKKIKILRSDGAKTPAPSSGPSMPVELSEDEKKILIDVKERDLTMTSYARLWTTMMACKHVVDRYIAGDFVECGVWRGGNALVAASIFKLHGARKNVYLFDTFEGMTAPTDKDKQLKDGATAAGEFLLNQRETHNEWCYASLEDVRGNFARAGLLNENVLFIQGDVCQTLDQEQNLPDRISVLRLDTDWYESTRKELEALYPRLEIGGILLIADYGHWMGSREATDEYFRLNNNRPFLQYVDYTCRAAVKVK